jgi:hypothetical protein
MRYNEDVKSRFIARHKVCIEFSDNLKKSGVGCGLLDCWYERFMVEKNYKFIVGIDLDRNALCKAQNARDCDVLLKTRSRHGILSKRNMMSSKIMPLNKRMSLQNFES